MVFCATGKLSARAREVELASCTFALLIATEKVLDKLNARAREVELIWHPKLNNGLVTICMSVIRP